MFITLITVKKQGGKNNSKKKSSVKIKKQSKTKKITVSFKSFNTCYRPSWVLKMQYLKAFQEMCVLDTFKSFKPQ